MASGGGADFGDDELVFFGLWVAFGVGEQTGGGLVVADTDLSEGPHEGVDRLLLALRDETVLQVSVDGGTLVLAADSREGYVLTGGVHGVADDLALLHIEASVQNFGDLGDSLGNVQMVHGLGSDEGEHIVVYPSPVGELIVDADLLEGLGRAGAEVEDLDYGRHVAVDVLAEGGDFAGGVRQSRIALVGLCFDLEVVLKVHEGVALLAVGGGVRNSDSSS